METQTDTSLKRKMKNFNKIYQNLLENKQVRTTSKRGSIAKNDYNSPNKNMILI